MELSQCIKRRILQLLLRQLESGITQVPIDTITGSLPTLSKHDVEVLLQQLRDNRGAIKTSSSNGHDIHYVSPTSSFRRVYNEALTSQSIGIEILEMLKVIRDSESLTLASLTENLAVKHELRDDALSYLRVRKYITQYENPGGEFVIQMTEEGSAFLVETPSREEVHMGDRITIENMTNSNFASKSEGAQQSITIELSSGTVKDAARVIRGAITQLETLGLEQELLGKIKKDLGYAADSLEDSTPDPKLAKSTVEKALTRLHDAGKDATSLAILLVPAINLLGQIMGNLPV